MRPGNPRSQRLLIAVVVALFSSVGISVAAMVQGRAAELSDGGGVFHTKCPFSHRAADDPVVHPGQPGRSHLHDFLANVSTDAFSTPESLRAAGTTCARKGDRSAYWTPTLYENESGGAIAPSQVTAYYRTGSGRDPKSIQPFPAGLKVIAGDAGAQESQAGRVVDFRCPPKQTLEVGKSDSTSARAQELRATVARLDRQVVRHRRNMRRSRRAIRRHRRAVRRQRTKGRSTKRASRRLARSKRAFRRHRRAFRRARAEKENREHALSLYLNGGGTSIPTCRPGANLELVVRFPDCWNGKSLDSGDHKSHMAYSRPASGPGYECPPSHSAAVPRLSLHVIYPTSGGPDIRLSPGDVDAGHADFVNAWDQEELKRLVRVCLNADFYCGSSKGPKDKPSPSPQPSPQPSPSPSPTPSPLPVSSP